MLLTQNTNEISGNLTFSKVVKMEIEASASGIILDSLIRIYSNPYVAAMREYTSNAWDSHRVAGQTKPIEVSLPSQLSPVFVVEDFGTGMTRIELGKYGQFGWSTKRNVEDEEANENIGGFGLGSKVGLAFSAQYTVRAVKDGFMNTVIIGRDKDGNPQMGFLNGPKVTDDLTEEEAELVELAYQGEPTDLPNGVKITIPTNEYYKFNEALSKNFFLGFAPGAIEINGRPVEHSVHDTSKFDKLEDGLGWRVKRGNSDKVGGVALIQGVSYNIEWGQVTNDIDYALRSSGFLQELVIDLPNGEVEIQRSRESLVYSKRTREILVAKFKAMLAYATVQYAKEIEEADTFREALQLRRKAISYGFNSAYTWKGKVISIDIPRTDKIANRSVTVSDIAYGGNSTSGLQARKSSIQLWQVPQYQSEKIYDAKARSILVHGAAEPTTVRNRTMHVEANGSVIWARDDAEADGVNEHIYTFYFTSVKPSKLPKSVKAMFYKVVPANLFMEKVTELRKASAQAAAATRKLNATPKVAPANLHVRKVVVLEDGRSYFNEVDATLLDQTKTYVILQAGESDFTDTLRSVLGTRKGANEKTYLFTLMNYLHQHQNYEYILANKTTKVKAFDGVVPNMVKGSHLPALIEALAKKIVASKTEIEKRAILDRSDSQAQWAARIPLKFIDQIVNDDTRTWAEAMKKDGGADNTFLNEVVRVGHLMGIDTKAAVITSSIASPASNYPLLPHLSGWHTEYSAVTDYINLVDQKNA